MSLEFVVGRSEFVKALSRVRSVVDKASHAPILGHVLVTSTDDGIRLAGTDLVLSAQTTVAATVQKPGSVALPAKALLDFVKALPDGEITVRVNDDHRARLVSGKRKFDLSGLSGDDFPALPQAPTDGVRQLPCAALGKLISLTAFSMATDDTRPHLNATLLETGGGRLQMVSTDGHRLSKASIEGECTGEPLTLLIPAKGVRELKKLLTADGTVEITSTEHALFATVGNTTVSCNLVDAAFPAYQQVIPKSLDSSVTTDRKGLLDAIQAVSLVNGDRSGGIRVAVEPGGTLTLEGENPDVGTCRDEIVIEYDGKPIAIGFNARYLTEALSAIPDSSVTIEFGGELDPSVIRAGDYLGVIMPIRL